MAMDWLPRADTDLLAWARVFVAYVTEHAAEIGLSSEDVATVTGLLDTFDGKLQDSCIAQQAARARCQAKDGSRQDFVAFLRAIVRRIQAAPGMTNDRRAAMRITCMDRTPTEAPRPATQPIAVVDTSQRFRHTIRFFDGGPSQRKARPRGVMGCEIWVKVDTTPPATESELRFLSMETSSPYVAQYTGEDVGKKAYYMLRWVSTRGQKGPWSAIAEATITG